jgi:hypothetical protein
MCDSSMGQIPEAVWPLRACQSQSAAGYSARSVKQDGSPLHERILAEIALSLP